MRLKNLISNNELTNLVCDFYENQNEDYDFDEIESTINSLDLDLRDELQNAIERNQGKRVREIIGPYN